MDGFIDIGEDKKEEYDNVVSHPLQTYEWGEFRKKTGVKVIRRGLIRNKKTVDGTRPELVEGFTLTIHKIPHTNFYIGYLPKGSEPSKEIIEELERIGREENCIFIQLEPNIQVNNELGIRNKEFDSIIHNSKFIVRPAAHPLFTKYTFVLDLTKQEEELLAQMHSKARYNIKVAQKHNVKVSEDNSEESFKTYLKLMTETTNRQAFYAHTPTYHKNLFETLPKSSNPNSLSYHLLNASYLPPTTSHPFILTSWVLFVFKDTLYYPYGVSSRLHRETMASNLIAWEAIKFGKKMGLKKFDMWGALGPEPDKNDPWYGFHRFKEGYGGELVEFVGSYDLVIKSQVYKVYKVADKLRWGILKLQKMLSR